MIFYNRYGAGVWLKKLSADIMSIQKKFSKFKYCCNHVIIKKSIYFLGCIMLMSFSHAKELTDAEIKNRFHVVPEPTCKKVKAREPAIPVKSFWYGRYYLSIDGKADCQILDVKIDWMTNRPTEFRKYLNSVLYRFNGKNWSEYRGLSYPPKYRIFDKDRKIIYMVVKNDEDDFPVNEIAFYTGKWDEERNGISAIQNLWDCEKSEACYREYINIKRAVSLYGSEK